MMKRNGVWKVVTTAWETAGFAGSIAPHDLRRSAAQIGVDAGASEEVVQDGLGHRDVKSTRTYIKTLPTRTHQKTMPHYIESALKGSEQPAPAIAGKSQQLSLW